MESIEHGELILYEVVVRQLTFVNVIVGAQYQWNHDNKWRRDSPKSVIQIKILHHKKYIGSGETKRGQPRKEGTPTMTAATKNASLRHNEYYGMQERLDELYQQSLTGKKFTQLYEEIVAEKNILLAYRNIKGNTGSKTKGTDNLSCCQKKRRV